MAGGKNNLKPVQTKAEARERGRRGGIASGEARREKRTIRERLELLLSMPAEADPKRDNADAMCAALVKRAAAGDVAAFTVIRDSIGERPTSKLAGPDGGPLEINHGIDPDLVEALATLKGGGGDA